MQTWTDTDKPLLYVINRYGMLVQLVEKYSSLVWTERYQEAGEFVLNIPLNAANLNTFQRNYYLKFTDSDEVMIIESINIDNKYDEPELKVTGRSLVSILERRINASKALELNLNKIVYQGSLHDVVDSIIKDEITEPYLEVYNWFHQQPILVEVTPDSQTWKFEEMSGRSDNEDITSYQRRSKVDAPYRKISNFEYEDRSGVDGLDKRFEELKTIYDLLVIFAKKTMTGFKMELTENNGFKLITYKGVNRTSKYTTSYPLIFSPILDNIASVNYFEDHSEYGNVAFSYTKISKSILKDYDGKELGEIGDYNDTGELTYVWVCNPEEQYVNDTLDEIDRREFIVKSSAKPDNPTADKSNIESGVYPGDSVSDDPEPPDIDEGEVPEFPIYEEEEAEKEVVTLEEKLTISAEEEYDSGDHDIVKTTEGTVDPGSRYAFGKDYFLGDIIEYYDDMGIHVASIIDEVVRSYDADGYVVTPNFKTMYDYDYGDEGDPDDDDEDSETNKDDETPKAPEE